MPQEPIGVTFVEDAAAIGVYESEAGSEAFETDGPYLMTDGKSLQAPTPVRVVESATYSDEFGNARPSLAINTAASIFLRTSRPWRDDLLWNDEISW